MSQGKLPKIALEKLPFQEGFFHLYLEDLFWGKSLCFRRESPQK